MATDKKHIAVYLDKAVEDALSKFCTDNGLESKKGLMYSAAVNKVLAQYFQLENTAPSNTPHTVLGNTHGNIPSNIPGNTASNTPSDIPDSLKQYIAQRLAETKEEILGEFAA